MVTYVLDTYLLSILRRRRIVVAADVAVQGADEDHGDHAGQEEDDHGGVGDGEPVDLVVGVAPVVLFWGGVGGLVE